MQNNGRLYEEKKKSCGKNVVYKNLWKNVAAKMSFIKIYEKTLQQNGRL